MLTKKNKGQISIEMLIIVGVLVVGAIIFASIYLGNIQTQAKKGSDLSSFVDDFLNDFGNWKNGPSPIADHCSNGFRDADEEGVDCGGDDCAACPVPGRLLIAVTIPNNERDTSINTSFNLLVQLTNSTGYDNNKAIVKKIEIEELITYSPTSNCSFNGEFKSEFNDLKIPFNDSNYAQLTFSCKEPGTYRFTVTAGIKGEDSNASLNDTKSKEKVITDGVTPPIPPTPMFSVKITKPDIDLFFNNQSIQLKAIDVNDPSARLFCNWSIGDVKIPSEDLFCDIPSYSLNSFKPGEYEIRVDAYKEGDGGVGSSSGRVNSYDKKRITILKSDPNALYLFEPGSQLVNKEFNLKVAGPQAQLININNTNFTFTGTNCTIDQSRAEISSMNVNGTTIFVKSFPTVCNKAYYTGPEVLGNTIVKFSNENYNFSVGYDLSLNFASCNDTASQYGYLKACVLSASGGNYNSDYWQNNSYGLLKIFVDSGENETNNNYGELKIYIE